MSAIEEMFAFQMKAAGLPLPEREYRFRETRRFRFDFAWPSKMLACEIQGGVWMNRGGHNTGSGITADCEKLSLAAVDGWRVLPVTSEHVKNGRALTWVEQAMKHCETLETKHD